MNQSSNGENIDSWRPFYLIESDNKIYVCWCFIAKSALRKPTYTPDFPGTEEAPKYLAWLSQETEYVRIQDRYKSQ